MDLTTWPVSGKSGALTFKSASCFKVGCMSDTDVELADEGIMLKQLLSSRQLPAEQALNNIKSSGLRDKALMDDLNCQRGGNPSAAESTDNTLRMK